MQFPSSELPRNATALANAIRALAMDAVQKANSGHPGMPMGMAEMATALWACHLKHNPANPNWADRDRFVVSNGHGSMLLYSLLHLAGYNLPIEELKNFRQLHSKTPGHPEFGMTPGVETTTGPLGQGITNAVGMALAERLLAAQFNKPGFDLVDHNTYVFLGDGCLMEGISHEACSLAGVWGLSKLIALYDDNGISIDGQVDAWFRDDTRKRFDAYGWNVIGPIDGHDADAVAKAIAQARQWAVNGQFGRLAPTIIICKTHIGKGSPNRANTAKAHGEALGDEEIALTRKAIDWPYAPFEIPDELKSAWDGRAAGAKREGEWNELFDRYAKAHPQEAAEFKRRMKGDLPKDFAEKTQALIKKLAGDNLTVASRKASQIVLDDIGPRVPGMLGGSADLTGSNLTNWKGVASLRVNTKGELTPGDHINYGVREFGMAAIMNGVALHGGFIPYGGTFLTFSDYSRNAIRMAALMKIRVVHVFTHDSIGLGEDGPTHQPVEHPASLRLIPNLHVWRPADAVETAVAWKSALERRDGPSALLLSRQNLAPQVCDPAMAADVAKGAYVLASDGRPQIVLMATGSEVALAMQASARLREQGVRVRVVSVPSTTVFDQQSVQYKDSVLPFGVPRVAVEAGVTDFWWKYQPDAVLGLDRYGESAPAGELFKYFGITVDSLVETAKAVLGQ
ncbi:MAG: transketolase [Burkholderiaceae bacterium]|nr:transketolase [Burkholderiaceae bacterium]